jgi:hypothetical protein
LGLGLSFSFSFFHSLLFLFHSFILSFSLSFFPFLILILFHHCFFSSQHQPERVDIPAYQNTELLSPDIFSAIHSQAHLRIQQSNLEATPQHKALDTIQTNEIEKPVEKVYIVSVFDFSLRYLYISLHITPLLSFTSSHTTPSTTPNLTTPFSPRKN